MIVLFYFFRVCELSRAILTVGVFGGMIEEEGGMDGWMLVCGFIIHIYFKCLAVRTSSVFCISSRISSHRMMICGFD